MSSKNNIVKQVYWIDDNIAKICSVMQGAFVKLWNLKGDGLRYKSNMIIFGNGWISPEDLSLLEEDREVELNKRLFQTYREECENVDRNYNGSTFKDNKKLIDNAIKILFKKDSSEDKIKFYNELYEYWTKKNLEKEEDYLCARDKVKQLIEYMSIENDSYVFIDIDLLYGDLKKLEDNKKIISMELFSQLSKLENKNLNCFFYSTNAVDNQYESRFNDIIKRNYKISDKIKVYDRNFFIRRGLDFDSVTRIFEN